MRAQILTWSMLGERAWSSRERVSTRFGLRGAREYGSWAPYKSGLATFSRHIFCTISTMTKPCSVPYAILGKRANLYFSRIGSVAMLTIRNWNLLITMLFGQDVFRSTMASGRWVALEIRPLCVGVLDVPEACRRSKIVKKKYIKKE